MIVPFAAAGRAMVPSVTARPSTVLVRAPRVEDVPTVRTQVETWADATDERWRRNNQIAISTTGLDRLQQINQGILLFKLLMGAFTAISLIVGGIGIMNVLLASVVERTREIGVRRAAGAKKRDIAVQFLAESVVISLAGAMLGAVLGIAGAFLVTAIMRAQTAAQVHAAATFGTLIVSMSAAIAVGLTFGTYPALKAALRRRALHAIDLARRGTWSDRRWGRCSESCGAAPRRVHPRGWNWELGVAVGPTGFSRRIPLF